jgi:serine/threonine-protein kinase
LEEVALAPASVPSIAVLPFTNLSADKENEYFSDGLAEDIIDALTQVPGLKVAARTSAFAFRGKEVDIGVIGAKLKVATILEGSVRKAGNRIRVTAQLVKASDGYHLWSQRYDRDMTDVFAIQDDISHAIVDNLRVRLMAGRPLVKRHTENVEAYNLFLRGRHCIVRATPESLAKGRQYLEQAIALDPDYALAYAGMAEYCWMCAFWGFMAPSEALPRAKSAALAALKLDDTLAEAHAVLGVARGIFDFDWVGAEQEFRRALELNPASPMVRYYYGFYFLRPRGRLDEALSQLQRVVELDPLSARYNASLGYLYYVTGQQDLAIAQQQRAIELDPSYYAPHWLLAIAYAYMGRFEEAIAAAQKACELSGRSARTLGLLALAYGRAGLRSEAQALLGELTTQRRRAYVPPIALAEAYVGLGEVDQALEWVEKGVEERDLQLLCGLKCEPGYVPLHGHPRYQALLRKMNLED